jgi:cytochrome c oxidase assembly protein subunit 11
MAASKQHTPGKTIAKLVGLAVAMFAFAIWVMPPLYTLFCEVTGLNGKTGGPYVEAVRAVDESRVVKVQFVAINNGEMSWDFRPVQYEVEVHPGEPTNISYFARNNTTQPMVAQAVPSLSPSNAAGYFHKTECFCFNRQPLGPGESAELGLQFIVDRDLPAQVKTITMSYTLFDVTEREKEPQVSAASN